jgi:ribosomal protein L37E
MAFTERKTVCPVCGYHGTHATETARDGGPPHDGDVSICLRCGDVAYFDSTLRKGLRRPTESQRDHILAAPEIQQALMAWKRMVLETGGVPYGTKNRG